MRKIPVILLTSLSFPKIGLVEVGKEIEVPLLSAINMFKNGIAKAKTKKLESEYLTDYTKKLEIEEENRIKANAILYKDTLCQELDILYREVVIKEALIEGITLNEDDIDLLVESLKNRE